MGLRVNQYWSWILAIAGLSGMWLAGQHNKWGWAICIGSQILWIPYALFTWQLGFLLSAVGYGSIYARNFIKWRRIERMAKEQGEREDASTLQAIR